MIVTHGVYLVVSVVIMVSVARSLSRSGRVFLVEVFGNTVTADAANTLLVVGFCVTKIGYAAIAIRWGGRPETFTGAVEFLAQKIGVVLLLLGAMHVFNVALLCHIRNTRASGAFLGRISKLFGFDAT